MLLAAVLVFLVNMVTSAENPPGHITCVAKRYQFGTTASVTCQFDKDMNIDKRPINVIRYINTTEKPGTDALLCQWNDAEKYKCKIGTGFSFDGNITDHLTLTFPADIPAFTELYSCFIVNADDITAHACTLTAYEDANGPADAGVKSTTDKRDLLWLLFLLPVVALMLAIAGFIVFRRRRKRNRRRRQENGKVHSPSTAPLIPQKAPNQEIKRALNIHHLSKANVRQVKKYLQEQMDASLKSDTGKNAMALPVPISALPDESANGALLVVDLSSTTLKIHLVRLEDDQGDSVLLLKEYEIQPTARLGTSNELFSFIGKSVLDFVNEKKMFGKKFRLVFVFSFPCQFDSNFTNARLSRWTRNFRCDGVVGENLKELLQEAIQREIDTLRNLDPVPHGKKKKKKPPTITVVAVVNDAVGLLMSVVYRDSSCKIALSLMDGFRACYLQESYAPRNVDHRVVSTAGRKNDYVLQRKDMDLVITDLGGVPVGKNCCLDQFRTAEDKLLDTYLIHRGEQSMEKMTSVMYIGEMVRLVLVQLIEAGLLFKSVPQKQFKLCERHTLNADTVSMIVNDKDETHLYTKHMLKTLQVHTSTDKDCQTVRYVCRTVSKRSAYLAAAGLATLIDRLDQPMVAVAIEEHLEKYHPHFCQFMKKRTRELVKPQLEFKFVSSQEGSSKGAARFATAVTPHFPRSATNFNG